jgi:hypothetical protein
MDLRIYYGKIREQEAIIAEEFPIVVSLETTDGGKEGIKAEVPKRIAAKMLVEGLVRLAGQEEAKAYRAAVAEAKRVAEQVAESAKVQLTVLSAAEIERLKAPARSAKA